MCRSGCRSLLWGKDPLVVKTRVSRREWCVDPGSHDHRAGAGHRVRGGGGLCRRVSVGPSHSPSRASLCIYTMTE